MKNKSLKLLVLLLIMIMATGVLLSGCGENKEDSASSAGSAPEIQGLKYKKTMDLKYAKEFNVYYYEDGYKLIDIKKDAKYLIIPKGKKTPEKLPEKVKTIKAPIKNIYLAATASMALFSSMDAMDTITMTSLRANGWSFDSVKKALKSGKMKFSGKYSEPDYEMLIEKKCKLAVESTMIYHTPEVKEAIEELKIPVMVDRSSYETHPLGRTEWVKLYGALTGKEEKADKFFEKQVKKIKQIEKIKNTEKTIAFFYISTDGKAVVRRSTDYIPTMIQIAGGRYIFKNLDDKDGKTSIPMTIEKFYDVAADADYIVYNGSIDHSVRNMKELLEKDPIMKKFKAVKTGNCWRTGASMYQRTDIVGDMIIDFNKLLTEKNPKNLKFISKLE